MKALHRKIVAFLQCSLESLKQKTGSTPVTSRKLLLESTIDPYQHGTIVDMAHFTAGGQNVICYATTRGKLCGLDLRSNETVWELSNNAKFGEMCSCLHATVEIKRWRFADLKRLPILKLTSCCSMVEHLLDILRSPRSWKNFSGWFNHIRLPQLLFIASPPGFNPLPAEIFFCGGHF